MSVEILGGPVASPNGKSVPLSKGIRAGDFVFLSGQLAFTPEGKLIEGGIKTQTSQCLDNIQALLEEAGLSRSDIVKCTIWLTDADDFAPFNEVYGEFFSQTPPTRSCVASQLIIPGALVEIEALAYSP